jgi:regulator of replication initiation timing
MAILSDAMAGLQQRIAELEEDNSAYRREISVLRLKLNSTTKTQTSSESELIFAAGGTIQMLASATETLKELRHVKQANRQLAAQCASMERSLGKLLRENADLKTKISVTRDKLQDSRGLQYEYDALFLEFLIPRQIRSPDKLHIAFAHSSVTRDTHSLPRKIQMLLQDLQALPIDFSKQRMDVKRRIIDVLGSAKEMVDYLEEEIAVIELESVGSTSQRRTRPVIERKQNHIAVIIQMMNRLQLTSADPTAAMRDSLSSPMRTVVGGRTIGPQIRSRADGLTPQVSGGG